MSGKKSWINWSIGGLCMVAMLGAVLRSKIVFSLPFVNYNRLLEAHGHFAFMGWLTLALLVLVLDELLPGPFSKKPVYGWLLAAILISSWAMLLAFLVNGYSPLTAAVSALYVILTYIFSWILIADLRRAAPERPILLLTVTAIICWILSSAGTIVIGYTVLTRSFNAVLYRDALFTYLHFNYNGFFTLAMLALLYHRIAPVLTPGSRKKWRRFSVVLCLSILPSLFLSYLWQDPDPLIRTIALTGTLLVWLSFLFFIPCIRSLQVALRDAPDNLLLPRPATSGPLTRFLFTLSVASFLLKLLLQGFTIFPGIGNALFGNRPVVMGFLHMVFLGFLSCSILALFTLNGWLDGNNGRTRLALYTFAIAILANEALLLGQGMATLLMPGSIPFPWLLWIAGIGLLTGALLIAHARIGSGRTPGPDSRSVEKN